MEPFLFYVTGRALVLDNKYLQQFKWPPSSFVSLSASPSFVFVTCANTKYYR